MSESSGLTNRYAKALYELAEEKKLVSKIVKDFQEIKTLLENGQKEKESHIEEEKEITEEEKLQLEDWKKSKENKSSFQKIKNLWELSDDHKSNYQPDLKRGFSRFLNRIKKEKNKPQVGRNRRKTHHRNTHHHRFRFAESAHKTIGRRSGQ